MRAPLRHFSRRRRRYRYASMPPLFSGRPLIIADFIYFHLIPSRQPPPVARCIIDRRRAAATTSPRCPAAASAAAFGFPFAIFFFSDTLRAAMRYAASCFA